MKKLFLISLAIVLAASIAVVGCEPGEPTERTTITLDFATFWPATDFQVVYGHQVWMDTISERVLAETDDYQVSWVKTYSVGPGALWTGVTGDTYDVITSGPGYTAGIFDLWEGPEYPAELPGRTNAYVMSMSLQALHDDYAPAKAEFDASGVKLMHLWATGPGWFLMTLGNNVTILDDFDGKTIRAANPASVACITALGATPGYMPMSAALEAFQAGTIDGILCPTDTPKGFGLGAYVRSATYAPFSYHFVFMKVMNTATYNGLPASVKAIVDEVNEAWPEYYGKLRTWGEYDGLQYCLGPSVPEFYVYDLPTEDATEYGLWKDEVADLVDTWIAAGDDPDAREWLWGNFTAIDAAAATAYGAWDHDWPTRPPVPTF